MRPSILALWLAAAPALYPQAVFRQALSDSQAEGVFLSLDYQQVRLGRNIPTANDPTGLVGLEDLKAPARAVGAMEKAESEVRKDHPKAALAHLRKAVEYFPGYSKAYLNMAILHIRLKQPEEAEKALKKAVEVNPNNLSARHSLGHLYLAVNRPQEALDALRPALDIDPTSGRSAYYLGESLFRLGQKGEAETYLRRAWNGDPKLYFAGYRLASLCADQGLFREALDLVRAILKMQHPGISDDNLQQLALALEKRTLP